MPHIVKSFDIELSKLEEGLARMGGLAEAQLAAAIEAL
ncbi:MAG: phosphate transport system regulatory protein PhoU, partial [Magnetospirillum sp.]